MIMVSTLRFPRALAVLLLLFYSSLCSAAQPLRALILTSPGVYHNYEQQTQDLGHGIAEHANVRFDVSLAELERWKTTDFSAGYDVLIYNICMADNQDDALIANLRRQTEQLGVPALVIHCTMHSFRETDLWWPMFGLQTKAHEELRPLLADTQANHIPFSAVSPADWTVASDELYINLEFTARAAAEQHGRGRQVAHDGLACLPGYDTHLWHYTGTQR